MFLGVCVTLSVCVDVFLLFPRAINTAELSQVVNWLLAQSGVPETACRVKCRQVFRELAGHLPSM
jgi:hypothetical protein